VTRFAALIVFGIVAAVVSSAGGIAGAAPVPKHLMKEAENPDLAALQGKWVLTGLALDGTPLTADTLAQIEMSFEFRGNTLVMTAAKQNLRSTATLKVDASANPRRVTFADDKVTDLDGKPVNNPSAGKMGTALYKLEGDTFVLATKADGKDGVPENFVAAPGSNTVVLTLKRVKK
jgi:uncharacterized protein (TIGR03067 family)